MTGLTVKCVAASAVLVSAIPVFAEPLPLQVSRAFVAFDQQTAEPVLTIEWSSDSAKQFTDFTAKHIGKTIEVRVGGVSVARPVLRDVISGPSIQIGGEFDLATLNQMAKQLSSGSATVDVDVTK